jgi:hypothetical protein
MGKITVYQCDNCLKEFKTSSDVLCIDGNILNGDGYIAISGDTNSLICIDCFNKLLGLVPKKVDSKELPVEETKESTIINKIFLKRINDEKEEDEFIKNIGHLTRDSFESVCKSNLINHYYPVVIEEGEAINHSAYKKTKTVSVIYKVFASIPQIKKIVVFLNENEDSALVDPIYLED